MRWLQFLILVIGVNFVTLSHAQQTTPLRGPKQFDTPAISRLGPLSAQDTLWRLAAQVRPDNRVSIYQVMFALYQKNPDAFLDGNFNHLRPGAYLDVPSMREVMAVDAQEAQRKSENDDRLWAEKIRQASVQRPDDLTAKQKDLEAAKEAISAELARVGEAQDEQLNVLQDKLSSSMANVETIVKENGTLKKQLDSVVSELGSVKQQLDKDSEIQRQLQQLLTQQAEMLQQQQDQIRRQEEESIANMLDKFANSPTGWVLAGALPASIVLFMIVSYIRRKGQKAAAVVTAATAAPAAAAMDYNSPLPPLDDSLDFDEHSLINLDDSLLNEGPGSGIRLDDDDFMPSSKPAAKGNMFADDDLLDDSLDLPSMSSSSSADDLGLDDLLDEPVASPQANKEFNPDSILSGDDLNALFDEVDQSFEAKTDYDPNNILSGNELNSLFDNLDLEEEPVMTAPTASAPADNTAENTVDSSADDEEEFDIDSILAQNSAAPDVLASAASESAEADQLLEEIELELPSDKPAPQETVDDDEFDIDALVNANQPLAAEAEPAVVPEPVAITEDEDFDIDALLADTQSMATTEPKPQPDAETEAAEAKFDSSDLDAFAESLAEETLPEQGQNLVPEDELLEDHDVLEVEELSQLDELDEILNEVAEIRAQSAQQYELDEQIPTEAWQAAREDYAEAGMASEDIQQLLTEPTDGNDIAHSTTPTVAAELADALDMDILSDDESPQQVETAEQIAEVDADPVLAAIEELNLEDADAIELDGILEEVADLDAPTAPSSFAVEHDSLAVEAQLAAEASAEAEYLSEFAELEAELAEMPDLATDETSEDLPPSRAQLSVENPSRVLEDYPELALDDVDDLDIFPDEHEALTDAEEPDDEQPSELTELEHTDFDALLADLSELPEAPAEDVSDLDSTAKALAELAAMPEPDAEIDPHSLVPDYVNIEKLLAAAEEQMPTAEQSPLNIDVGLSDFEDLISADEIGDVDLQDNGFASRLDLVRAYIEIGDQESADQLIQELVNSAAPEHVKAEAKSLHS